MVIKFNKKKPNISLTFSVYNGENIENKDIKCLVQTKKDFINIHFKF